VEHDLFGKPVSTPDRVRFPDHALTWTHRHGAFLGTECAGGKSGGSVGFSLGLIAGGVPLLFYVVGIDDAHVAIGTSALNAFGNLIGH
jgi:hypothetical protein